MLSQVYLGANYVNALSLVILGFSSTCVSLTLRVIVIPAALGHVVSRQTVNYIHESMPSGIFAKVLALYGQCIVFPRVKWLRFWGPVGRVYLQWAGIIGTM